MSELSPAFTVGRPNPFALRGYLDQLRELVTAYTTQAPGLALGDFDRTRVLSSIQTVLERLDLIPASALELNVAGPSAWLPGRGPDLDTMLSGLQSALER